MIFNFESKNCIIFDNAEMNVEQQNEATLKMLSKLCPVATGSK